jgi:hypothetical protein
MKIVGVRHIEDCFDGSYIHEILFDADITAAFIRSLGTEGQLQYYPNFARPFFKAMFQDRFTLKGVEGNRTVRVLSYEKDLERTLTHLSQLIVGSENPACGAGCDGEESGREVIKSHISE